MNELLNSFIEYLKEAIISFTEAYTPAVVYVKAEYYDLKARY